VIGQQPLEQALRVAQQSRIARVARVQAQAYKRRARQQCGPDIERRR
jgi:hypothetical protein